MKALFYKDGKHLKVEFDGEWNALSMFIETDGEWSEIRKHIELNKKDGCAGNTSSITHISGSKYCVFCTLGLGLSSVEIDQKQLLKIFDAWDEFNRDRKKKSFIIEV